MTDKGMCLKSAVFPIIVTVALLIEYRTIESVMSDSRVESVVRRDADFAAPRASDLHAVGGTGHEERVCESLRPGPARPRSRDPAAR